MTAVLDRRRFLVASSIVGAGAAVGCVTRPASTPLSTIPAPAPQWAFLATETALLAAPRADLDIVTRGSTSSRVLRQRTRLVAQGVDLADVSRRMEVAMLAAKGVGLAGPQVGLNLRVATLMLDYKSDKPRIQFFRNPVIVERSDDTIEGYEGCLSIPGVGGLVRRSRTVRVSHDTPEGETLFEEATGYNAVLWQHELDHLEGVLYVDRLLGELLPMDEVRRRREERDKQNSVDKPADSAHQSKTYADGILFA